MSKIQTEKQTVKIMIEFYCSRHHDPINNLCDSCLQLYDYSMECLDNCPYQEKKPTCEKCKVHCYKPDKREQIVTIMRYSGPRMIFYHPILTVKHLMKKYL